MATTLESLCEALGLSRGMNITRKNLEKAIRQQPKLLGRTIGKLWLQHLVSSSEEKILLDNDLVPLKDNNEFWKIVSDRLINPQEVRLLLWELSGYMGDECFHPSGLHFIREAVGWAVLDD